MISAEAGNSLIAYIERMRQRGFAIFATAALGADCARGFFIAPTLIEINAVADLGGEVFGPVLHVLRFRREALHGLARCAERHRLWADR